MEVRAGASSSPGGSCPIVEAYLPPVHTIVHITYSLLRCHLAGQRPHLGRRAFGAVGRHISTDRLVATPAQYHRAGARGMPSTNQPPTCPPTTATRQLRCPNCHQGVEGTKLYHCISLEALMLDFSHMHDYWVFHNIATFGQHIICIN